jgi:hypothetical protein
MTWDFLDQGQAERPPLWFRIVYSWPTLALLVVLIFVGLGLTLRRAQG